MRLWLDAARVAPYDTAALNDRLGRDCLAQLLVTFWTTLALGASRAAWTIERFPGLVWHLAFYGGCVFLVWLNQLSYVALMGDEYDDAFSYPSKDSSRRNAQVLSLGGTILFTVAVLVELWNAQSARRAKVEPVDLQREVLNNLDETGRTFLTGAAFSLLDKPPLRAAPEAKRGRYAAVPSLSRLGR